MASSFPEWEPRYDAYDHPLASWDDHPACRSCLHTQGFCTRNSPYLTCQAWSPQMWKAYGAAELRSAQKRLQRHQATACRAADRAAWLSPGPGCEARFLGRHQAELMPRPPPRTVTVTVPGRNAAKGTDFDWSLLKSHSGQELAGFGHRSSSHKVETTATA